MDPERIALAVVIFRFALSVLCLGGAITMVYVGYRLLLRAVGLAGDDAALELAASQIKLSVRARRIGTVCFLVAPVWVILAILVAPIYLFQNGKIQVSLLQQGLEKHLMASVDDRFRASDAKVDELQKSVETSQMDITKLRSSNASHEDKIARLLDTSKEALSRANEANKIANHAFLFEVTLSSEAVQFGSTKSDLSAEARAAADAFAKRVKDLNKDVYIEIQGHTDTVEIQTTPAGMTPDQYAFSLGQERAETVRRYLSLQHGFPLVRMSSISYGCLEPIADNSTLEGRAKDRRVALVVLQ